MMTNTASFIALFAALLDEALEISHHLIERKAQFSVNPVTLHDIFTYMVGAMDPEALAVANVLAGNDPDAAALEVTLIRKGTKIDNLVQIAHNVEIGENTVIAAQTGISGSTKIGRNCMIAGQVGIVGHLTARNIPFSQ